MVKQTAFDADSPCAGQVLGQRNWPYSCTFAKAGLFGIGSATSA